jgi:hypothetical protein
MEAKYCTVSGFVIRKLESYMVHLKINSCRHICLPAGCASKQVVEYLCHSCPYLHSSHPNTGITKATAVAPLSSYRPPNKTPGVAK